MKKIFLVICCFIASQNLLSAPVPRLVLVFPFENYSSRPDLDWLSEGIAELLATRLSSSNWYILSRHDRNAAYRHLGLPAESPLTLASKFEVAQTLGADEAIVGNFNVVGDQLTIRAQHLDVRRLKLDPPLEVSGKLEELLSLENDLAWRFLALYNPLFTVGPEKDFSARFPPIRLDSFESYIRGIESPNGKSKVKFLAEADHLDPSNHAPAFALGLYYFQQKNYAQSAQWFGKLAPSDARYDEEQFYLGVDKFFLGNYPAAQQAFDPLAQRIPLGAVSNNLGAAEAAQGHYQQALANFERAVRGEPNVADFSFNAAVCDWYLQNYSQAAKFLKSAMESAPRDAEIHTMLESVDQKLGDARGQQVQVQWLSRHEGESGVQLAQGYMPQTRIEKTYNGRAFRLLMISVQNAIANRLADEPPAEQGRAHLKLGQEDLDAGRLNFARSELNEAAALIPQSSEVHLALGKLYAAEKQFKKAAAELETSLNLKETVAAHLALGRVYLALSLPEAARVQEKAALRIDPGNPEAKQLVQQITEKTATEGDRR